MLIMCVDNDVKSLNLLTNLLQQQVQNDSKIYAFENVSKLFETIMKNKIVFDIAFINMQLLHRSGIEVAQKLKQINEKINIVFMSNEYDNIAEAISLYPSDYILKPFSKQTLEKTLMNLRYPIVNYLKPKLFVQTFGNFEVFVDGKPLKFKRQKSKELFAYLIDRKGAMVNINELCAVLWENNGEDTKAQRSYLRILISDITNTLLSVGFNDLFLKQRKQYGVAFEKIDCDYYRYLKKDLTAIYNYSGDYMKQYSWAEYSFYKNKTLAYEINNRLLLKRKKSK